MANRDVQLIIRARDEASRAIKTIANELAQLDIRQQGVKASGTQMSASVVEAARQLAQFESVVGLTAVASERAEKAITQQRVSIAATAAELAAVQRQLAAARSAIDNAQGNVVNARLAGGSGAGEVAALQAAQQAARDLEQQQTRLSRTLAQQEGALDSQERNFRELASTVNTAEAALETFGDEATRSSLRAAAAAEETTRALREQAAAARDVAEAQQAQDRFSAFLGVSADPGGAQARQSALVFEEAQRSEDALRRLQDRINPLSVIERRLAADTKLVEQAFGKGRITSDQFKQALVDLQQEADDARASLDRVRRGEKGRPSLFGLKPFELTNLGFQVNDVITQLASGTSLTQTLAQQGGQILQLLPNIGAKLVAVFTNPFFLGAAVVMGAFALAVKEASDEAERLRKIEAIIGASSNGAAATAAELNAIAREIENIGFSAEESLGLVQTFLREGLNPDFLLAFAEQAKNLSIITGEEIPQAQEKLIDSFNRGFAAVAKLDDQIQFLTLAEREHIRAMFESGDASGARTQAFVIFRREAQKIADKSQGEWAQAVDKLESGFDKLLNTLGNIDAIEAFSAGLSKAAADFDNAFTKNADASLELVEKRLAQLEEVRRRNPIDENTTVITLFGENTIDEDIAALRARRAELLKMQEATGDLRDEESVAARKRESDELRRIQRERELENARTSAQRIALEGEKAFQEAVDEGHSKRVAQARREQAIEQQRIKERERADREKKKREDEFARQIAEQGRSNLLDTARSFVGRNENNADDRQVLDELFDFAELDIDPTLIAWCAALVNGVLAKNGLPTLNQSTGGNNLRARDFLAFGSEVTKPEPGDIVILKRGNSGSQGHVGFFTGFTDKGDVRVLGGNQRDQVSEATFKKEDVLGFRRAPSQGDVAEQQAKEDLARVKAQTELNEEIDRENAERQLATGFLREQLSLSGEALIDAQREQAVLETIAKAQEKAAKDDLVISEERLQAIRDTVEAEFNLANARERASAALDDATAVRDALLERLDIAEQFGDSAEISRIEGEIAQVDQALRNAITSAIAFYQTLGDNPQVVAQIQTLRNSLDRIGTDTSARQRQRVEQPVAALQAQRNALLEQVNFFRELGQTSVSEQLLEQVRAVETRLLAATDAALLFWQTQSGPDAQAAILNLQSLRNQVLAAQNEFAITAGQIQDAFAGSFADGFRTFAEVLTETKDPLDALAQGALQFAADFTRKLAEMGLELLAFKLATELGFSGFADSFNSVLGNGTLALSAGPLAAAGAAVSAGGVAVTGGATALGIAAAALADAAGLLLIANTTSAGIFHGGGIAGSANRSRAVAPAWFAAAVRYHSGGIAGLRPNEVPTILERGEEVLTRSDPRHRFNAVGESGSPTGGISQILAIGEDSIAKAMRSASGERVILTTIETNRETIRSMLNA